MRLGLKVREVGFRALSLGFGKYMTSIGFIVERICEFGALARSANQKARKSPLVFSMAVVVA